MPQFLPAIAQATRVLSPGESLAIEFYPAPAASLRLETYAQNRLVRTGTGIIENPTSRRLELHATDGTVFLSRTLSAGDVGATGNADVPTQLPADSGDGVWTARLTNAEPQRSDPRLFSLRVRYPSRIPLEEVDIPGAFWDASLLKGLFESIQFHLHHGNNESWVSMAGMRPSRFTIPDFRSTGINDVNSVLPPETSAHRRFSIEPGPSGAGVVVLKFVFEEFGQEFIAVRSGGFHGHMWNVLVIVRLPLVARPTSYEVWRPSIRAEASLELDLANVPESWFDAEEHTESGFVSLMEKTFRNSAVQDVITQLLTNALFNELERPPFATGDSVQSKKDYWRIQRVYVQPDRSLKVRYYHPGFAVSADPRPIE